MEEELSVKEEEPMKEKENVNIVIFQGHADGQSLTWGSDSFTGPLLNESRGQDDKTFPNSPGENTC